MFGSKNLGNRFSIFFDSGRNADYNSAFAKPAFIRVRALFWQSGADQKTHQSACHAASAGACQCAGDRPCYQQAQSRQNQRCPDRRQGAHNRSRCAADRAANSGPFQSVSSRLGRQWVLVRIQTASCFVGHDQINVIPRIPKINQGTVRSLGVIPVPEEACNNRVASGSCCI
jgi:hypothetical protein